MKISADAGKKLYEGVCQACHAAGIAGAPKFGDKTVWADRIKQGAPTLYEHAIKGYQGKAGVMPAKGGSAASDDEVKAAVDYMIAAGFMDASQDNPTYDGSDAQFVSSNGGVIQQGFATNEVYKYENEINWKDGAPADVSFYTVSDMGFDNYPAAITMMRDRVEELDACLTLLVPVMQQAWIDFLNDPTPIMNKMIEINQVHDGFWGLSEAVNEGGFALVESDGFATNSPDGT